MAGVVQAAYDARIAWLSQVLGIFQLDRSTVGGTDVLAASSWSQTFNGPYDSLLANGLRIDSLTATRGRSDDLSSVQAGTAEVVVIDYAGLLNPKNTASPLYDAVNLKTNVRPNRPARFLMMYAGATYPLFYGFVRTLDYDPGIRIGSAKIELDDLFGWLDTPRDDGSGASPFPVIARMNNTTTGAAIGAILDWIGWTDTAMRVIDAGDNIPWFEATGDKTPLQLIAELVAANGGIFYIDAAGRAVFEDRNTRWFRASYATITNTMTALNPGTSRDNITNTWNGVRQYEQATGISFIADDGSVQFDAVTLADGPTQTATDAASRAEFGIRSNDVTSKYFPDDTFALGAVQWRLTKTKDPATPVWSMDIDNREDTLMLAIAGAELQKRITVNEARYATTGDYFIEQITHAVSRADRSHKCTMVLSERLPGQVPFRVDVDTVSGPAGLGF